MSHINLYDAENVADLLKGVYPVMISQYDYGEPLPTATDRVMKEYIYVSPSKDRKNIFQQALTILLNGSAADVFLAAEYFDCCLYFESKGTASFNIDKEIFVPLIRQGIRKHEPELKKGITFVDGTVNKYPMERLNILNRSMNNKYGFSIID